MAQQRTPPAAYLYFAFISSFFGVWLAGGAVSGNLTGRVAAWVAVVSTVVLLALALPGGLRLVRNAGDRRFRLLQLGVTIYLACAGLLFMTLVLLFV